LTPEQLRLRGQIGAFALHAAGGTNTAPARAAFMRKFDDQVDPDRVLPEGERSRRADLAKRQYYTAMALRSSIARGRKARTSTPDEEAQAA
jgi:hypothetical protein